MASSHKRLNFKEELLKLCDPSFELSSDAHSCDFLIDHNLSFGELLQLLPPTEVRNIRDSNVHNFLTLLRSLSTRLIQLVKLRDVPLSQFPLNKLLNLIRALVIMLPYLYEVSELQSMERLLFWSMENSIDENADDDNRSPSSMANTVGSISTPSTGSSNQLSDSNSTSGNVNYKLTRQLSNASIKANFGKANFQSHALGFKLVLVLVDLLFTSGLTVPINNIISRPSVKPLMANTLDFTVWEAGIGSFGNDNSGVQNLKFVDPKLDLDSNRFEVLRLLITLTSQCLFKTTNNLVPSGSRFLTVMVTSLPKLQVLTLISSLVNLTCRTSKIVNNGIDSILNQDLRKMRILFVTNAIQFFSLLIVYPLPKADLDFLKKLKILDDAANPNSINLIRFYCGKLHKDEELTFLENGLCNPLLELLNLQDPSVQQQQQQQQSSDATSQHSPTSPQQPQQSSLSSFKTKFLGSSVTPSTWSIELIILFWEFYQCNKKFRNYISVKKGSKLMIVLLYYIQTFKNNETYRNLVRLLSYLFLFLSHDPIVSRTLVTPIPSSFLNSLPQSFKTTESSITYRDFILIHSSNILLSDPPFLLVPTIVEWIYNLVPLVPPQLLSQSSISNSSSGSNNLQQVPILSNRRSSSTSNHSMSSANVSQRFPIDLMSIQASSLLIQVIGKFSTLTIAGSGKVVDSDLNLDLNLDLMSLLVRSLTHAILRTPDKHHYLLIYAIFKSQASFTGVLRNITVLSKELNRRGDSEEEDSGEATDMGRASVSGSVTPTVESNKSPQMRPVASRHSSQISISSAIIPPQQQQQQQQQQPQRHLSQASLQSMNSRSSMDSNPPSNDEAGNTLDSITEGVESNLIRPRLPTGMSEKAKSKQLLNAPLEKTWNGLNSLKIILHLIEFIKINISASILSSKDSGVIINKIKSLDFKEFILSCKANGIIISKDFLPVSISSNSLTLQGSVFEPLKFQWSNLSLGWYESILWGSIYNNFEAPKTYNANNSFSGGVTGKGLLDMSTSLQAFKKVGHDWGFSWGSDNSTSANAAANFNKESNDADAVKRLQLTSEEDYINIINNATVNLNTWSSLKIKLFKINKSNGSTNMTKDFTDNLIRRLGSISFRRNSSVASINTNSSDQTSPVMLQSPTVPAPHSLQNSTFSGAGALNIFKNQNPFSNSTRSNTASPILGYFPPLETSNEDDFDLYPNSSSMPGTPIYDRSPKISISDDFVANTNSNRNSLSISRTYSRNSNLNLNSKANTPKVGTPILAPQP